MLTFFLVVHAVVEPHLDVRHEPAAKRLSFG